MPLTLNATSYNAFVEFFGEELEEKGRVAGREEGRQEGRQEGKQEERQRSAFQTTIGCAKVNLPLETTIDLAGIVAETCILFLNKYKELGEDVYQWFENEYIKEFLAKISKK